MYETEGSSIASSGSSYEEQNYMEPFINRCSICFDSQLDLCLEYCRDQYCIECFQKYVIEVVKSSWGLSVTPIRCPVCNALIPKHEWSKYVPRKIIEMYDKFNKPYRSYTRACSHCETDIIPCMYNHNTTLIQQPSRLFCDLMETMLNNCPKAEKHKNHPEHISIKRWIPIYKRQDCSDNKLLVLYKHIMKDVLEFEKNHNSRSNQNYAYNISLQFINFCVKPEIWKQIQFAHIKFFPDMICSHCKVRICLHCGYDSHIGFSCEENMKEMLSNKHIQKDIKETVRWELNNSRRCPNCSIMINRDEGCNKVDCSYCGFCFCWTCRLSWTEGCGFYRCLNEKEEEEENNDDIPSFKYEALKEEKTEIGVPNIKNIEARLINNNQYDRMEMD
ncbi:uncharacterized protein BX663DRAFT_496350 [Cokeromyces recurvatus]|uniref:uncharacterized protein n=1 Tax=Cokeromyces recurvatus TaxID=90255 RepID=UPI00221FE241|nr:uncharacterized protein BX663DRAFT_496350 [Cokeromyces recurvatus]KAI7906419.1 hypothetical protein BX663DRAFT_496350 [Cokeromyces recurvatus]